MRSGGRVDVVAKLARRAVSAALLLLALSSANAHAVTNVCRQLEAQLTALSSNAGSGQAGRYDQAIITQQRQIDRANEQARQAGCGHSISGGSIALCAELAAKLEQMRINLVELQGRRSQMGGGVTGERARIMASLNVNGCRDAGKTVAVPPPGPRTRIQAVIDGRTGLRIGGIEGRFRTVCVRACDGYYFPISYSVGQEAFEHDRNACSAGCPGAEVELYYHRIPGEDVSDMVSIATGQRYSESPNAFLYRRTDVRQPQGCGCGVAVEGPSGFDVIGGESRPGMVGESEEGMSTPIAPPATEDTTPSITSLGEPVAPAAAPEPEPHADPIARPVDPDSDVRVVGPRFLPDPEGAIDLQAPDQTRDP